MTGPDRVTQQARTRLRTKFILAVALLALTISLLIVAIQHYNARREVIRQTLANGHALANTIRSSARSSEIAGSQEHLSGILRELQNVPDVEYADFISASGKVMAATDEMKMPERFKGRQMTTDEEGKTKAGGVAFFFIRPLLGAVSPGTNGGARGYFRLALNDTSARSAMRRLALSSALVSLFAVAVAIALANLAAGRIVRPVLGLVESATEISKGDLTRRTDVSSTDELGSLAQGFNEMAGSLEKTIAKVIRAQGQLNSVSETVGSRSRKVNSSVDEQKVVLEQAYYSIDSLNGGIRKISSNIEALSSSSEETASSILQMVASMEEVSRHTDTLFASVEDTASATNQMVSSIKEVDQNVDFLRNFVTDTSSSMVQMSASINQVEANAATSYDLSQAVADAAEQGMKAVRETMEGMEQIRQSVSQANGVVARLGERSFEIGKILSVIEDVAEQTNLLALNAAILAAAAGEHGKGFSVVAAEIRDLSERTSSSTREIGGLIKAVQAEVTNALAAMAQGSRMVEQGVELAHEAGRALTRILDSATRSSEMGKEIASATREQASGSLEVAESIEKVMEMVRQISGATGQQAAGSQHILRAVDSMREVTRYVRQATSEQKSGSAMISKAADRMIDMVHEIFGVTANQASESEKIVGTMERVREFAEANRSATSEVNESLILLAEAIRGLDEEVRRFKIRA